MDMVDEMGRSFVQVICRKYNRDDYPYCRGLESSVVIRTSPQGSPVKGCLILPSVLVLDSAGISHAGNEEEVATLCAHVVELDLSDNQFSDWGEISKILSNIPNLHFLNLSMNPLKGSILERGCAEAFPGLRRLVLNSTHVSWDVVHTVTQEIPELEELFLCLNEYERVNLSRVPCLSLRLLHISDNLLQDWGEVRKLGLLFPRLTSLILANNSLSSIHEPEESLQYLFPNLHSINLHNSGLNCWEDIKNLKFFPKLREVCLRGIPLLQPYTAQERRYLTIAHLPAVTVLDGSVVTDGDREEVERYYIYYHLDCPEDELSQELPQRMEPLPNSWWTFPCSVSCCNVWKEIVDKTPKKRWEDLRSDLVDWRLQCPRGTREFITMARVLTRDLKFIKTKKQKTFDLDVNRGLRLVTTSYHLGRQLELGVCCDTGHEYDQAAYDICGTVEFNNIYMEASKNITMVMLGDDILWTDTPTRLQRALDALPEAELWLDFSCLVKGWPNQIPLSMLLNCEDLYVLEYTNEDRKRLSEERSERFVTIFSRVYNTLIKMY